MCLLKRRENEIALDYLCVVCYFLWGFSGGGFLVKRFVLLLWRFLGGYPSYCRYWGTEKTWELNWGTDSQDT